MAWRSLFKKATFKFLSSQTAPDGFCRLHLCYTGIFTQGAATQPTIGAQAQYRQTNENGE